MTFQHDYYADGACGDISLVPTAETAALLPKYRLLFGAINKKKPSSYQLLQESVETAPLTYSPLIPLPTSYELRFEMHLTHAAFMNFTDFDGHAPKSSEEIYFFENQAGASLFPSPDLITSGVYEKMGLAGDLVRLDGLGSAVIVSVTRPGGPTLFTTTAFEEGSDFVAVVELDKYDSGVYVLQWGATTKRIYHDPRLVGKGLFGILQIKAGGSYSVFPNYLHAFVARLATWKYYVLPKGGTVVPGTYSISSTGTSFDAGQVFDLNSAPSDLKTAMAAGGFSNAVVFTSVLPTDEIAYSETARSFITLNRTISASTKTLVNHLPNPSAGSPNATVIVVVDAPV